MKQISEKEKPAKRGIQVFLTEAAIGKLEGMREQGYSRSAAMAAIVDEYFKSEREIG